MSLLTRLKGADWGRVSRFASVGILGTLVYYLSLWLMVEKLGVGVLIATNLTFLIVTVENYILHYHWTFASDNAHRVAFPRFFLMNVGGFFINWTVMYVGVRWSPFNYLIVQALSIGFVVVWNYLLTHFWIFRDHGTRASEMV